jgi:hypothetical protein
MVKRLLPLLLLTACSPAQWWGEAPPPARVAEAPKSASDACPEPAALLKGSEAESQQALECLNSDIEDAWKKIRGQESESLAEAEIDTLIERGIIDLAKGNTALSKRKVRAVRRLLAIDSRITKKDTKALLAWLQEHRQELRRLYQLFSHAESDIRYQDFRAALELSSSYLKHRNWKIPREELGRALVDLTADGNAESVTPEVVLVVHDAVGALCPGHQKRGIWDGALLSSCLDSLAQDFDAGSDWVDFVLNQVRPGVDLEKVKKSLDNFLPVVEKRMSHPDATGLNPALWVALARKLKAMPPEGFLESLNIIGKLHSKSSGHYIDPGAITLTLRIVRAYHELMLNGIPSFREAHAKGKCVNAATDWRNCVLPDPHSIRNQAFQKILKSRNTAYGEYALPFDGHLFKKIALFHALSGEIISSFDSDKDGVISSRWDDSQDEIMNLVSVSLSSVDVITRFINNMKARVRGDALFEQEEFSSIGHLNLKGLARLITLAGGEIIVNREKEERIFLEKLIANLTNSFPTNSVQLDHDAMSATLVFVSSFGAYRDSYLSTPGILQRPHPRYGKTQVDRPSVIQALPKILERNFPRTLKSCQSFGFERSCGISMDEVLPPADPGGDWTSASDLDILTMITASLESLLDSCDYDGSGTLGWNLFDGQDELDCTFTKFSSVTKRLMEAKIVNVEQEQRVRALLSSLNSIFITRSFAKVAMIKGTTSGIVAAPITLWFQKDASLGSIYALLAETLAKDRVKALENPQ